MSDKSATCDDFEQWLLDGGTELEGTEWAGHIADCAGCREQWHPHRMLAVAFADMEAPELSPGFDAALDQKLAATPVEIRPLTGWRSAAMLGYTAAGIGALGWLLKDVPLPTIDPSASWVPVVALGAVPLSFMLAIAASRLLPTRGVPLGPSLFAL